LEGQEKGVKAVENRKKELDKERKLVSQSLNSVQTAEGRRGSSDVNRTSNNTFAGPEG